VSNARCSTESDRRGTNVGLNGITSLNTYHYGDWLRSVIPVTGRDYFDITFKLALSPPSLLHNVSRGLSHPGKGFRIDHSPPSSAKVKNA
jgi:hypothetical protein